MRLSELIQDPSNLWLWHPVLPGCLPWVQANGLAYPFLFGKRNAASSLRLPRNRLILRVASPRLIEAKLSKDFSLKMARSTCQNGCNWDGEFRRWLMSLPLKNSDILTRWAQGEFIGQKIDQQSIIKQLHRLDARGLWRYSGVIDPADISVLDPDTNYYVGIQSWEQP